MVSLLTLRLLSLRSLLAELNPLELEVLLPSPTCLGLEGRLDLNFCNMDCFGGASPRSDSLLTCGDLIPSVGRSEHTPVINGVGKIFKYFST